MIYPFILTKLNNYIRIYSLLMAYLIQNNGHVFSFKLLMIKKDFFKKINPILPQKTILILINSNNLTYI